MKWIYLVFGIVISFSSVLAVASAGESFVSAVKSYEQGHFPEAVASLEATLKVTDNGDAWYDLGDAYYRNREMGKAIFAFRKAQERLPRDPDVRFNLSYLRQRTPDKVAPSGIQSSLNDLFAISQREWQLFLAFATVLAWGFALATSVFQAPQLKKLRTGFFTLWGLAVLVAAVKLLVTAPFGVITGTEVEVFSGFSKGDALLFKLHEGTEFTIGDSSQSDWLQIQLPDGKKGWLKRAAAITSI